ncbi:hypothetical protein [Methyloraptor flagellatus]|jgi:hypothetical protein|uniref:Argininosuccinate lyase n=1 Tax=Methyloraptor flagellatus TaxID=3162530 RepID=A0AAU7X8B0_9HYPH
MRKFMFASALMFGSLVAGNAFAAEAKQDFTLVNKTGYEIKSVFVSPSKSNDWEEDVLGRDTFADGDSWDIKFHRAAKTCKWDLKVVYSDDDSDAVWDNIDLCSVSKITIKYDRKKNVTSAIFD